MAGNFALGMFLGGGVPPIVNLHINYLHSAVGAMVSGFCAGTGAIHINRVDELRPTYRRGEFDSAISCRGRSRRHGAGNIRQVITGMVVLTLLSNVMNMVSVSAYYQTLAVGIVIILAVILDRFRRRESH